LIQVAADLLKQYKQKFQGGTLAVTWNYLRESMNTYLSQPNPVTARWEGTEHLRDPKFQLDAFRVSSCPWLFLKNHTHKPSNHLYFSLKIL
jgi:acyl-CoA oxidase